jgi:kynureninase
LTIVDLPSSRDDALRLDAADQIAHFRDGFVLPEDVIYLDGNSLGPPPQAVFERVNAVLREEWSGDLIRAWTTRGWIDLPERVGEAIAGLIGARSDEVVVADSITVNLFKLLGAAIHLRPGRKVILSESGNFGTDLYVAQGLADTLGQSVGLRLVDRQNVVSALDEDVAVLMLTHVDFRSGEMHDMKALTRAAHEAGALILWDLAHSAGAVLVDLETCSVDLAVGCGYKYLNGGPGAPAFVYVSRRHHADLRSPLWGWMGHEAPFEFDSEYRPAAGVGRLRVGTPQILGLAALECGVASIAEIGVDALRSKSVDLTECFLRLVNRLNAEYGFGLASPLDADTRGSQVSLRHPEGYAIMQALIAAGVIGDFRAPDLLRFGFAPAYVRFVDVWDAVAILRGIMEDETWRRPEFRTRAKVT